MKKVLLSIKPLYVERILQGIKKVEYRKHVPKCRETNKVLIYRSNDIKKVVAEFAIEGIIEGTPQEVWNMTKNIGGINESDYFNYFANSKKAYAIKISQLCIFKSPIDLASLGVFRAPMSYQYVEITKK